jgi:tetratricopeptide (TPR) repeat protein
LSLSFEKVHQTNPSATDIIQVFAFLNSDAIPEDILTQGSSALGVVLKKVANDPLLLNDAIGTLLTYSLLHRNPDHTFTVHRLVQAVVRHNMSPNKQGLWVKRAISAIKLTFPEVDYSNWERCQQYIPHIQVCVELLDQLGLALAEEADLLTEAGQYLDKSAQYQEAEIFYQHALAIQEKTLGPEHPQTAHSLRCMAKLYREQGKYEQAEAFYQHALAIREKVLGLEHPKTVFTLSGYAVLLRKVQRIQEARVFEKRVRATRKKTSDLRDS